MSQPLLASGELASRLARLVRKAAKMDDAEHPLPPDRELVELGVDSYALVELIMAVEEEFNIAIPDELMTPETFRSINTLLAAIEHVAGSTADG